MKHKTIRKCPLSLTIGIASVLFLAGCSSSSNNTNGGTDGSTDNGMVESTDGGLEGIAAGLPLDTLRESLIVDLAGYTLETLSEELLLIGATLSADAGTALDAGSFTIPVRDQQEITATTRTRYDCPLGGTVVAEIGELLISESSYSNSAGLQIYTFDQCLVNTDVEHSLDGTVRVLFNRVSASRATVSNGEFQWSGLTWGLGQSRTIEGTALIVSNQLDSVDDDEVRNVSIEQFSDTRSGTVEKRIENGAMALRLATEGSGFEEIFELTTSGRVTTSAGVGVQINTDVVFSAVQTRLESPDSEEPFSGELSMVADDGGRLTMTALPMAGAGPRLVDVEYISVSGETQTQAGVEFPELTINAP